MPARRDSDGLVCQRGLHPLEGRHTCRECANQRDRQRRARGGAAPRLGMFVPPLWVGDVSWMDRALCRAYDPELWFTEHRKDSAGHAKARSVCARCPVRADCLDYALAMGERHGVWGGVGERDRAQLRTRVEAGAGVL